jgi:transposase-like protein
MKNSQKKFVETTVKTRQAIADEYGVDRKTLYNWLKKAEIIIRANSAITPEEQAIIYKEFGDPSEYRRRMAKRNR